MPGAGGALVLVHAALDEQRGARECVARAGVGEHGLSRVALVRHRRRPAALSLRHLADLRLREQYDVERDLRDRDRSLRECAAEGDERRAARVPRQHGLRQAELLGVEREHVGATVAERAERAGRAAELRGQLDRAQTTARVDERDQPACGLETERRRHRLLQERPRGHHCAAMLAREARARLGGARELRVDDPQRACRDEHRRGVEDVLARRAAVHIRRVRLADRARIARTSGSTGLPAHVPRPRARRCRSGRRRAPP